MQIINSVGWEKTVLPIWNSTHPSLVEPNKFIWTQFPSDLVWHSALIESGDIDQICVIGSSDWFDVFQTYRLKKLCQTFDAAVIPKDTSKHVDRIKALQSYFATGKTLAPLILIAPDNRGPYVIVDGNHRASALLLNGDLVGQQVMIGTSKAVATHVVFYDHSVAM